MWKIYIKYPIIKVDCLISGKSDMANKIFNKLKRDAVKIKSNDCIGLRTIPGVGKSIAADLRSLGIYTVKDLKYKDPEIMYIQLMDKKGSHIDRCVLYVFRCAVYYAEHDKHDPEKLKWWNWKDKSSF